MSAIDSDQARPPLAADGLSAALKRLTQAAHRDVESRQNLASTVTDADQFCRWLMQTLALYRPLEALLHGARGPFLGRLVDRRNWLSPTIERDLERLGVSSRDISDAPPTALPALDSEFQMIGAVYVLEGSRLGGPIIRRDLVGRGIAAAASSEFLRAGAEAPGADWQAFRRLLDAIGIEMPAATDAIVSGAIRTFAAIGDWMETGASLRTARS